MTRKLDDQFHASRTMDRETLREYLKAVPNPQAVANFAKPSTSLPLVSGESPKKGTPNYTEPASLDVPGVAICDKLMDMQDALDLRDRKQRLGVKDDPT